MAKAKSCTHRSEVANNSLAAQSAEAPCRHLLEGNSKPAKPVNVAVSLRETIAE